MRVLGVGFGRNARHDGQRAKSTVTHESKPADRSRRSERRPARTHLEKTLSARPRNTTHPRAPYRHQLTADHRLSRRGVQRQR
jgi:hypothetical protein